MQLGLFQKQTMKLVMTTELRQAIALLQYSTIELSEFIQDEALENPLIELEEKTPDVHIEERYELAYRHSKSGDANERVDPLDFITSENYDPREELLEQVRFAPVSEQERTILNYLVLNLDDNGYLPLTNTEAAHMLNIDEENIQYYIDLLQQLEPVGVGARDLRECLTLQALAFFPDEPIIAQVITDYLGLLADKKWQEISRVLDISLAEIKEIFSRIQILDPKPCAKIDHTGQAGYLYPDILIDKNEHAEYTIALNDNYVPNIQVNQQYMNLINNKNDTSKYISQNYKRYMWLINSIEQRRSTILKIARVIADKQRDFLENGFASLQAMTLQDVADEIDMHESTVSRATNNKVIRTPAGSFEMSRLFSSKLGKSDGDNTSSTKVKILLKQYIEEEDKHKPFSDQKIADYFQKENGIAISRRTVAKYREELNILSSSKRKEIV